MKNNLRDLYCVRIVRVENNYQDDMGIMMTSTAHRQFKNLYIFDHPLIQDKLSRIRMKETKAGELRAYLTEISLLMGFEVTRDFALKNKQIDTPLIPMEAPFLEKDQTTIVPILRAGLGMVDGFLKLMPTARVGHLGLYRDPQTHRPVEYLNRLPAADGQTFILLDPMLATGYSAAFAVDVLLKHGVPAGNIRFVSLVAAPEGVAVFEEKHPNIPIYTASLDERLNDKDYILPGLGDAGDRLFGTK